MAPRRNTFSLHDIMPILLEVAGTVGKVLQNTTPDFNRDKFLQDLTALVQKHGGGEDASSVKVETSSLTPSRLRYNHAADLIAAAFYAQDENRGQLSAESLTYLTQAFAHHSSMKSLVEALHEYNHEAHLQETASDVMDDKEDDSDEDEELSALVKAMEGTDEDSDEDGPEELDLSSEGDDVPDTQTTEEGTLHRKLQVSLNRAAIATVTKDRSPADNVAVVLANRVALDGSSRAKTEAEALLASLES